MNKYFSFKFQARYIHNNGYGGVMVWAIDLDDVTGSCGDGRYPLMRTLFQELPDIEIVGWCHVIIDLLLYKYDFDRQTL